MAGRIRPENIQAVRERTDLATVVSSYLQLKKAGHDRLVGLCPFHAEKTGSFTVSPSKQLYHCFGCGEGGNVFTFLVKVENLSFGEAVERLAASTGITLRYEGQTTADRRSAGRRQALHRAIAEAARLYQRTLLERREAADARRYLADRGITEQSVERFGIGYAPGYPDFLLERLSKSYSPELLVEAGLVSKDERGNIRDRFRGRVMFPIHDLSGNAVAFGGRLLAGAQAPPNAAKYVNSPETPVYHKGTLLYNLNRAKIDIARTGRAYLVEGYTDVIALDQAGAATGVATCGTALGEDHIRLLARFAQRVVLAFDSDEAGARAAERAYQFHERYPVDLSVLVLPQGQDPADFVQARGEQAGAALDDLSRQAVPLVEYMIERTLKGRDLSAIEERVRAIRAGLALVAGLEDPVRRQEYARVLAGKVGEPEVSVMLELEQMLGAQGVSSGEGDRATRSRVPPSQKVEREALKLLLQVPELCLPRSDQLTSDRFDTPGYRAVFELMREAGDGRGSPSTLVALARERPRGDQLGKLLAALAVEAPETVGDVARPYVDQVFYRLEEFALKRQSEEIRKQLERLNPEKHQQEHQALFERFVRLEAARREIRAAAEAVGSIV
jgi:DNA primase